MTECSDNGLTFLAAYTRIQLQGGHAAATEAFDVFPQTGATCSGSRDLNSAVPKLV